MSSALRLPRVPEPPHDPRSLLLAPWKGLAPLQGWRWRQLQGLQLSHGHGALQLAPTLDSARRLTDARGSFGGLKLPPHLAAGPDGRLLLLDAARGRLLGFDACCCRFQPLPCGWQLAAPQACGLPAAPHRHVPFTQLLEPGGIAVCDGRLALADSGHARVLLFALAGFVPRAALQLPASVAASLATPWWPREVAFDGRGRLWVLDARNGRIDAFDAQGRWLGLAAALAGASHLMVDCADRPVVAATQEHAAGFAPAFPQPSFVEIDAGDADTDWQQLRFTALPPGCRFDVDARVADAALGPAALAQLPGSAWQRCAGDIQQAQQDQPLPLVLDSGRVLQLRIVPRLAWPAGAPALVARAAQAWRIEGGAAQRMDLRADQPGLPPPVVAELPWHVDAEGRLLLQCTAPLEEARGAWTAFDAWGQTVGLRQPAPWRYKRSGVALTARLDSAIEGCHWHRVELRGSLPEGCSVEVRTVTATIDLDDADIAALPDSAWCTRIVLGQAGGGRHDCLVMSPPGRYLWLRLQLRGDGERTPCIESIAIEYPRISLRRYLPAVFGADPQGADFTDRFTALFDATLRSIEAPIDDLASFVDPLSAPTGEPGRDFLAWLAGWLGEPAYAELPEAQRRHLIKQAPRLFALRGTPEGLRRQLWLLLGMDRALAACQDQRGRRWCTPRPPNCAAPPPCLPAEPPPLLLEHFKLRRWLHADKGRLGDDAELWGDSIVNRTQLDVHAQVGGTRLVSTPDPLRDPLLVHAHRASVFVPASVACTPALQRALQRLLQREVPAHVEVQLHPVAPRFQVGRQAMLGLDAVVARLPRGVGLPGQGEPASRLGQGSVLQGAPQLGSAPRVGDARIGAGMALG
jgi:phage tail-like protein